jgi:hypothetical protein
LARRESVHWAHDSIRVLAGRGDRCQSSYCSGLTATSSLFTIARLDFITTPLSRRASATIAALVYQNIDKCLGLVRPTAIARRAKEKHEAHATTDSVQWRLHAASDLSRSTHRLPTPFARPRSLRSLATSSRLSTSSTTSVTLLACASSSPRRPRQRRARRPRPSAGHCRPCVARHTQNLQSLLKKHNTIVT